MISKISFMMQNQMKPTKRLKLWTTEILKFKINSSKMNWWTIETILPTSIWTSKSFRMTTDRWTWSWRKKRWTSREREMLFWARKLKWNVLIWRSASSESSRQTLMFSKSKSKLRIGTSRRIFTLSKKERRICRRSLKMLRMKWISLAKEKEILL